MHPTPTYFPKRDRSHHVFAVGVLFFLVRVIGSRWRAGFPLELPDSFSYLDVSRQSVLSSRFWFGDRPLLTPVTLWLLSHQTRIFVVLEALLYAVVIAFLCSVVLQIFRNRYLAWICNALIFAVAIQPRFSLWSAEVLSESLGITLSVLMIGSWLLVGRQMSSKGIYVATAVTIVWLFARDSHVIPVFVLGVILLIFAYVLRTSVFRSPLTGAAVALFIALTFTLVAQGASNRNQFSLMNNVGKVILPSSEMTQYFSAHGMPMSNALVDRTGKDSWADGEVFLKGESLETFRQWVNGSGQFTFLRSLIEKPGFWIDRVINDVDQMLQYDFHDYDRFSVRNRLPDNLFGISAIGSVGQLGVLIVGALVSIAGLLRIPRRRGIALVLAGGLTAFLAEMYVSAASDAVEVQRHLIGPIFRIIVVSLIAFFCLVDHLLHSPSDPEASSKFARPSRVLSIYAGWTAVIAVLAGWFATEYRSQDFDPQFARTLIERVATFGGTYYQNAIHNKGPLEPFIYASAKWFTSYDSYWFAIATYILIACFVLTLVASVIARLFGASSLVTWACSGLVLAHFFFSSSDYASVLYSRNITTCFLAAAVGLVLWEGVWETEKGARRAFVVVALLVGLSVQTLLTSALVAFLVVLLVLAMRGHQVPIRRQFVSFAMISGLTIVSVPIWYVVRGSFHEFWSGWWTYAGFMSKSTNRSFIDQLELGRHTFYTYYHQRPVLLWALTCAVIIFFIFRNSLHRNQRIIAVLLLAWLTSGWIELVLSQRYSSHYFSVVAVPSAFMFVAALSILWQSVAKYVGHRHPNKISLVIPVLLCSVLLLFQGTDSLFDGLSRVGRFTTFAAESQRNRENRDPESRLVQSVVDLVSPTDGAMLAWTMYPWTYLNYRRVPATRFSWKSFMEGEIYMGSTSSKYVLEDTWKWFAEDMKQTEPQVYLRPIEIDTNPSSPFFKYADSQFSLVLTSAKLDVQIRKNLLAKLVSPVTQGSSVKELSACFRVAGTIDPSEVRQDSEPPYVVISDRSMKKSDQKIVLPIGTPFSLVVGSKSAVLFEGNQVTSALAVSPDSHFFFSTNMATNVASEPLGYLPGCQRVTG